MSIVWRKVWRDLWCDKLRTLLVVLSTAVGVLAIGLVFGSSDVMRTRMTDDHRASIAPHIEFYTSRFDQDVVDAILREPGVADAQGESQSPFFWKFEDETDWRDGVLVVRADYESQRMNLFDLLDGEWPAERTLAVGRMTSRYLDILPDTTIVVELGRRERRLPIEGIVRHPRAQPPQAGGFVTFFATPETAAWLASQEEGTDDKHPFNQLYVRLESLPELVPFEEGANEAAEQIQRRLERIGVSVGGRWITPPDVHWAQDVMDTILLILTVMGVLSLALSGFLIINVMNATVAQQVWQIGVMKVLGATRGRITSVYLAMVSVYGLLSLLLAVPLGAIAAHLMANWALDTFNVVPGDFQVTPVAVSIQVAVGLVVPLLAALAPVIGGARITPHQAISTYGLGGGFGRNWLDRLVLILIGDRVHCLPRPLALSLRNTFRRKARVTLTLLTLVLGGMMFIIVLSLDASFNNTIAVLFDELGYDVEVEFDHAQSVTRLVEVAESVPGVIKAEVWDSRGANLSLANGEDRRVYLRGVPPDSAMFTPRTVSGRGLLPDDGNAILFNNRVALDEGIQVGDEIELTIAGRESVWTVVGLILNVNDENFVPFDVLAREMGASNKGSVVMVMSKEHAPETQERLARDLRDAYTARHIKVSSFHSLGKVQQEGRELFRVVTYVLLTMVVLAAMVGSIGLMSTMSINVAERRREIGVMRAIGASSSAIAGIFVAEGVLVGMLSWLLAVPLSYPCALAFSNVVGYALIQVSFDFSYSLVGVALWLLVVVVFSALASLWPALRAARVSVRETLTYE